MKICFNISIALVLFCFAGCINARSYDVVIQNIGLERSFDESQVEIDGQPLPMGIISPKFFCIFAHVEDTVKLNGKMILSWERENGHSFSKNFDLKNKFPDLDVNEFYIIVFKIDDHDNASVGVYICKRPKTCLDDWL